MLSRVNLSIKIGGGFGIILILLIIISVLSWNGFRNLANNFSYYQLKVDEAGLQSKFGMDLQKIRFQVAEFIITQSDENVNQYTRLYQEMTELLNTAAVWSLLLLKRCLLL